VLRRILAAATALTLLAGGAALVAGPADAAKKTSFRLSVYDLPWCSVCDAPFTRAQGAPLKVLGFLDAGKKRPYVVQQRAGNTWRVIQRRSTHHGSTAFQVTESLTGNYAIRAVASRIRGHRRVISKTIAWTVILKTTVSTAYAANPAPANSSVVVSGQITPATDRYVGIETTDTRYGHPSYGWIMRSNPDGTFAISVPTKGPGTYRFRVRVSATDTEAEANVWLPDLTVG
jgi:hypothetical protein